MDLERLRKQIEFIKEIDKVKSIFHIRRHQVHSVSSRIQEGSEPLWALAQDLIAQSVKNGYLGP